MRQEALRCTRAFIEVASSWGATVNVGRLRGRLPDDDDEPREVFEQRVLASFQEMGKYAARHSTTLGLEPIKSFWAGRHLRELLRSLEGFGG